MPDVTYQGAVYAVRGGETLLDALLRGGADIPFSCRKGSCQSCVVQATSGPLPKESQRHMRGELVESNHFMPCLCKPTEDMAIAPPDLAQLTMSALVVAKEHLSPQVIKLLLEPEIAMTWTPGQYLNIHHQGVARSYSIASVAEEDYYLELHVRKYPGGRISAWLHDDIQPGDMLSIQGPLGSCTYDPTHNQRDLVMLGTSTGLAPLWGIARDALRQGHTGHITLFHGAKSTDELYLHQALLDLEAHYDHFTYIPCVSQSISEDGPHTNKIRPGRVTDLAFRGTSKTQALAHEHHDLNLDDPKEESAADYEGSVVYLCGHPEMVYDARCRAVLAGVIRADIYTDPFESDEPYMPDDRAKLKSFEPDPALWEALKKGAGLREILEDFYDRAYQDALLSPYFHNVTKDRAISKQYEFLARSFSGQGGYFGLNPFNAHHWMVISDELFDYREALMEDCVMRYGLSPHLLRRWRAFHELFRREIVKAKARGIVEHGVEHKQEGFSVEVIECATVCDGCTGEIEQGDTIRLHNRTGQVFCARCGAEAVVNAVGAPA